MTRKHFIDFAERIAIIEDPAMRAAAAHAVADVCEQYNLLFQRDRFLTACRVAIPPHLTRK